MRFFIFHVAYWVTSIFFVLTALPLLLLPGRRVVMRWIRLYTQVMCFWMEKIGGLELQVQGRERLPEGPFILAAKHQSWGDGFFIFSQFEDLAFVTGSHLETYPFVSGILRKMGSIVVKNCGGPAEREKLLNAQMAEARVQKRRILIYPEGHLSAVGEKHRYRKGVYHMYRAYGCPVVPVATNLGLRWPQQTRKLNPGPAALEFLDPIPPGLDKEVFMAVLEDEIETHSLALLPDGLAPPVATLAESYRTDDRTPV